jgi:NAD(P)-dependent dehydrogenase (short-subunit alcohol dehydrogenase family)
MTRLQDKVAIITGAAAGIGAGTAEVFAEQAARLVLVDRDGEGLERTAQRLLADPGNVVTYVGDVADAETARGAVRLADAAFGGADILFNNAGVMTYGDFRDVDEPAWDNVLNINLRGIYLMCRAVIPGMLQRGHGAIVSTSSVMAFLTEPGYEAYSTSKAGIIGLTKALAVSYATQGIRVNCICPGWVDTPLNQKLAEEMGGIENLTPIILRQQPNGRMLSTREIGNAVAFLASDDASGITGAALYVDGGASAAI